jgi:hypothetical protein
MSTQLYSARLTHQKERKDSKNMQGYLACGLLQLQEALLKVHPYIQFLLATLISSSTNHSMQTSMLFFSQGLSNQNHFTIFHVPVLNTVLDHSQVVPSRRNSDS